MQDKVRFKNKKANHFQQKKMENKLVNSRHRKEATQVMQNRSNELSTTTT